MNELATQWNIQSKEASGRCARKPVLISVANIKLSIYNCPKHM